MNPVSLHLPSRGYSSNLLEKYQYYKDSGKYHKVVLVPGHKSQGPMSHHRPFSRQPTEHPNDRPEPSHSARSEQHVIHDGMRNMHLQNDYKNPISPTQKVMEWKQEISDTEESFVIDNMSDFSTSVGGDLESYPSHPDYHRSVSEQGSSDDDAGLQKSLIGITPPPPGANETSSRPSSNGSQTSVASNLSFHTVYLSEPFRKPKTKFEEAPPPMRKLNPQTSQSESQQPQTSRGPVLKLHQTVSTDPYSRQSQPHPETSGAPNQSGVRQQINNQASREASTSVFITYAEEQQNPGFKRVVLQLTKTLLSNGIQVRLDMLESTLMSMSVSSWLDDNIQKCDFVIVCVSPSYKAEVAQQDLLETPDPHSLHTRYIYSRLLTEYIQKGSRNYRFIPVLMGGATRRDLPSWLLDTNVYEWPSQYEAIIYRLFKKEKYIQPRVGPPPICTVEAYGSHDEMTSGH